MEDALMDRNQIRTMLMAGADGLPKRVKATPSGAMSMGMAEALSKTIDSILAAEEGFTYVKLTASGVAYSGACVFGGLTIMSATSATATVYDNTAASGETPDGTVSQTLMGGTQRIVNKPIKFNNGVYVSITGTAVVYALVRPV